MCGHKIVPFLDGRRGPHEDSSRAGCGPRAGRCVPLLYIVEDCQISNVPCICTVLGTSGIIRVTSFWAIIRAQGSGKCFIIHVIRPIIFMKTNRGIIMLAM